MENQDFTTAILVDQTPEEAFNAINNVRGWWTESIEGSTNKVNNEFAYSYKDIHQSKMKIIELIPTQKVVWLVTDNYFKFTNDKTEWIGTKIIFEISKKENKTEIRLTHQGLVPQYECYEVCHGAWSHYMNDSLRSLIATGKGLPSRKEVRGFDSEHVEKWQLDNKIG